MAADEIDAVLDTIEERLEAMRAALAAAQADRLPLEACALQQALAAAGPLRREAGSLNPAQRRRIARAGAQVAAQRAALARAGAAAQRALEVLLPAAPAGYTASGHRARPATGGVAAA